jgi:hypothetical protein
VDPGSEANKRPGMHGGKSEHLNMTCDIGEPDSPGPDRGKRGVNAISLRAGPRLNISRHKRNASLQADCLVGARAKRARR